MATVIWALLAFDELGETDNELGEADFFVEGNSCLFLCG